MKPGSFVLVGVSDEGDDDLEYSDSGYGDIKLSGVFI